MFDKLFVRHHAMAMLDEIQEHVKHFGFQLQRLASTADFVETRVEPPLAADVNRPHCAPHDSSSFCELNFPATIRTALSWSRCVEVNGSVTWAKAWSRCLSHRRTSASLPTRCSRSRGTWSNRICKTSITGR